MSFRKSRLTLAEINYLPPVTMREIGSKSLTKSLRSMERNRTILPGLNPRMRSLKANTQI
jgi:hypothetical protein